MASSYPRSVGPASAATTTMEAVSSALTAVQDKLGAVYAPLMNDSFNWKTQSEDQLKAWAPVWVSVGFLYLPIMFGLQRISNSFKPLRGPIRYIWGVWNFVTALFSAIGFITVIIPFITTLRNFEATCTVPNKIVNWDSRVGQWTFYFIVSKLFELGDSVFLALLQKEIGFLHWYHHITIFVFMYLGGLDWHHHMISGVAWNYGVHAIMYAYYACACFNIRWPRALAQSVTTLQILQMFCQCILAVASAVTCGWNSQGHYSGLAMYAVYLVLFLDFFFGKYTRPAKGKGAKAKTN